MLPRFLAEPFGLFMFAAVVVLLMAGFPVALTLAGTGFLFAAIGAAIGLFDFHLLSALPLRIIGLMDNDLLQAVPLFIYLGVALHRTTLARDMLEGMEGLFGRRPGGLGFATLIVGALLAPLTGVVGATVLTIGLLALPSMLKAGYDHRLASGIICSAGTLGTILPPSIILILLSDLMQGALADARLRTGEIGATVMTSSDIFLGAILPVALLFTLYMLYVAAVAWRAPGRAPPLSVSQPSRPGAIRLIVSLVAPVMLIVVMLGAIVSGLAYTVEAAALGAVGATFLALARRELDPARLGEVVREASKLSAMVFLLLIGATTFSLVFRGLNGDLFVARLLAGVPGGVIGATAAVMAIIFALGFFLDALEIMLLVVPIAMPPLLMLGADPVWLAVLTAVNLHTSFLAPPFGFALFFLRSIAPKEVATVDIYRGALPFILIHLVALTLLWTNPRLVTFLPGLLNRAPSSVPGAEPANVPFNPVVNPYGDGDPESP